MTPLSRIIMDQIAQRGPLSIDRYMQLCLLHPTHGYYTQSQPFGAAGDFVTAPEISQMFGEMLGLWAAQVWIDAGRPAPFNLVELGPGRATMMADLLRAAGSVPGFLDAATIQLIEASPALRQTQATTLAPHDITHVSAITDMPARFSLIFANEYFDALPTRQFQSLGEVWMERVIQNSDMQSNDGQSNDNGLCFGLAPLKDAPDLPHASDGTVLEVAPARQQIAREIGAHLAANDGAALIIDYGANDGFGDTLQAIKAHQPIDPLAAPGACDLTTHVRFDALAKAAAPAHAAPLITQGVFLERLGIVQRAQALAQKDEGKIAAQLRRLTHPDEMGALFKVLALSGTTTNLPGFDP